MRVRGMQAATKQNGPDVFAVQQNRPFEHQSAVLERVADVPAFDGTDGSTTPQVVRQKRSIFTEYCRAHNALIRAQGGKSLLGGMAVLKGQRRGCIGPNYLSQCGDLGKRLLAEVDRLE